jgi:hypothetical protein
MKEEEVIAKVNVVAYELSLLTNYVKTGVSREREVIKRLHAIRQKVLEISKLINLDDETLFDYNKPK